MSGKRRAHTVVVEANCADMGIVDVLCVSGTEPAIYSRKSDANAYVSLMRNACPNEVYKVITVELK
jgi:hypothetical protein